MFELPKQSTSKKYDDLGYLITRASKVLRRRLNQALRGFDLTDRQFGLLHKLYEEDGLSTKELIERLFSDNATIVDMIDRMEEKGLVKRHEDSADARITRIFLTKKASESMPRILRQVDELNSAISKSLTLNELDTLKSVLIKLASIDQKQEQSKQKPK